MKEPGRSRSSRTRGQEIPRIAIDRRRLQLSRLVVFSASPVLLVLDREFEMCHSAAQQLLRPRSPRLLGASEIAEPRVQDGSQSADRFLFLFFFTLKISTYLYDWRTPGYAVAHPAYPVGPSLSTHMHVPANDYMVRSLLHKGFVGRLKTICRNGLASHPYQTISTNHTIVGAVLRPPLQIGVAVVLVTSIIPVCRGGLI